MKKIDKSYTNFFNFSENQHFVLSQTIKLSENHNLEFLDLSNFNLTHTQIQKDDSEESSFDV